MYLVVATPTPQTMEQIDAVLAEVGGPPEGLEERFVGTTDDGGFRIVTLWDSKQHAERFFADELGPALARVLGPEVTGASWQMGLEIVRRHVRQPVA
jgi:hypothetical protein